MKVTINRAKAHRIMSKITCLVMIAMAIVSFTSCEEEDDTYIGDCEISGNVVDYETGLPLQGALIEITPYSGSVVSNAYSNSNGKYRLVVYNKVQSSMGNGTVFITCNANGYSRESLSMYRIAGKKVITLSFALKKRK